MIDLLIYSRWWRSNNEVSFPPVMRHVSSPFLSTHRAWQGLLFQVRRMKEKENEDVMEVPSLQIWLLMSIWQVEHHQQKHLSHSDGGLKGGGLGVCVTPSDPDPLSISSCQVARWGCYDPPHPQHTHIPPHMHQAQFEQSRVNDSK